MTPDPWPRALASTPTLPPAITNPHPNPDPHSNQLAHMGEEEVRLCELHAELELPPPPPPPSELRPEEAPERGAQQWQRPWGPRRPVGPAQRLGTRMPSPQAQGAPLLPGRAGAQPQQAAEEQQEEEAPRGPPTGASCNRP